jgi:hypothetical protein
MPNKIRYFAATPDGNLLITTGYDAVERWDGLSASIGPAGVPAPSTSVSLATTGQGGILGAITAYQRWLDADGNPGALSPVSAELAIASTSGNITNATNATPIVVTSNSHGLSNGEFVVVRGVTGLISANGRWEVASVTTHTFELVASVGSADYVAGGTWKQGANQIDYTSVDAPTDSRVVTRQILRTKDGDAGTIYIDVETTDLSSTSFSSTNDDDDLGFNGIPLFDTSGNDNAVSKYDEPPDYKPYMAFLNGRMLATGDPIYTQGAVLVTNGSATVTGIDTEFTAEMAGRELWVKGSNVRYTISSVSEANQTLTLSVNYAGTTQQYAQYAIRMPVGYRRSFEWSAVFAPEAWDPANSQEVPEDRTAGEISAIVAHQRWAYIFAEARVWRVSFQTDPATDGYVASAPQRGLVNQRSWAIVDDYIALMDRRGVYEFAGNDMRDVARAIQAAWYPGEDQSPSYRIQWQWSKYFHCVNDPETDTIRWFISLTGRYPRHCFAFSRRTKAWWIEEYPFGVPSSVLGKLGNRKQVFLGGEARKILALNQGSLDGPKKDAENLRGNVASATATSITVAATPLPPESQVLNCALHIVSGKGKNQWRKIVNIDGTRIDIDQVWLDVPDSTSVYQIGGIGWRWKSGRFRWAVNDKEQSRGVEVLSKPTAAAARMALRVYSNQEADPKEWGVDATADENRGVGIVSGDPSLEIDTTKENGWVRQDLSSGRDTDFDGERFVAVELIGVTNGERQVIREVSIEGAG